MSHPEVIGPGSSSLRTVSIISLEYAKFFDRLLNTVWLVSKERLGIRGTESLPEEGSLYSDLNKEYKSAR